MAVAFRDITPRGFRQSESKWWLKAPSHPYLRFSLSNTYGCISFIRKLLCLLRRTIYFFAFAPELNCRERVRWCMDYGEIDQILNFFYSIQAITPCGHTSSTQASNLILICMYKIENITNNSVVWALQPQGWPFLRYRIQPSPLRLGVGKKLHMTPSAIVLDAMSLGRSPGIYGAHRLRKVFSTPSRAWKRTRNRELW